MFFHFSLEDICQLLWQDRLKKVVEKTQKVAILDWAELTEFAEQNQERLVNEVFMPMLPMYGIGFLILVLKVVAALLANRLYYKKACTEIKRIRSTTTDERKVQVELFRKGGTNILFGSGSYLIGDLLIYAASYFMMQ